MMPALKCVVAEIAHQRVDVVAAPDQVVTLSAAQKIVAESAVDRVVAEIAVDRIVAVAAGDRVIVRAAVDPVRSRAAVERVVAGIALQIIRTVAAADEVARIRAAIGRLAIEMVVAGIAVQRVRAVAAGQIVMPVEARQEIGEAAAGQIVVAGQHVRQRAERVVVGDPVVEIDRARLQAGDREGRLAEQGFLQAGDRTGQRIAENIVGDAEAGEMLDIAAADIDRQLGVGNLGDGAIPQIGDVEQIHAKREIAGDNICHILPRIERRSPPACPSANMRRRNDSIDPP